MLKVNRDPAELPDKVQPQNPVNLLFICRQDPGQVHDGNPALGPHPVFNLEQDFRSHGIADEPGTGRPRMRGRQF